MASAASPQRPKSGAGMSAAQHAQLLQAQLDAERAARVDAEGERDALLRLVHEGQQVRSERDALADLVGLLKAELRK
jgi:hypothetical protein